jgi:hypothetical protein
MERGKSKSRGKQYGPDPISCRAASFIGLTAMLILVSFLYQRFMTGRDEEEKQEG